MTRLEIIVKQSEENEVIKALECTEEEFYYCRLDAASSRLSRPEDYCILIIYSDNVAAHNITQSIQRLKEKINNEQITIFSIPFYDL